MSTDAEILAAHIELGTPRIQLLIESLLKEITQDCLAETQAPTCKVTVDIKLSLPVEFKQQAHVYFPKLEAMLRKAGEKTNNQTVDMPTLRREP